MEKAFNAQYTPMVAGLFFFRTLTHSTTAAPELSMQLSIVCRKVLVLIHGFFNLLLSCSIPLVGSSCLHNVAFTSRRNSKMFRS